MDLFEYIHQTNQAQDLATLTQLYSKELEHYGYNHFVCFSPHGPEPEITSLINGRLHFSQELLDLYRRHKAVRTDPVYKLLHTAQRPFTWDQVWKLYLNKGQKSVMQMRKDVGLIKGVTIPVSDHKLIGISICSTFSDARNDDKALSLLYAMTNQYRLRRSELFFCEQYPRSLRRN